MADEQNSPLLASNRESESESSSSNKDDDIHRINGVFDFSRAFFMESKRLWYLAGPAIFTSFCQFGLITVTQIFSGHLGTNQQAAVSVENNIISGFPYGLMFGMSSALETYCGQAFGANQYKMLGVYMQRTWVILNAMALAFIPLFIFATPVLTFLGQTASVAREAGRFSLYMIPEHFAYAMTLPTAKFLQAQSKVVVLAVIAAAALCLHAFLSWLLITVLGWGLAGAAVALDASWCFIAIAQILFVIAGTCGDAWSGFSWKAFQDLGRFFKLSIASAMMSCMETWYIFALTLFAGHLEDAEISIDAFSICINILGWACMVALGLTVASSVRVSNELGCGRPMKSKFAVVVSGVYSLLIGLFFSLILVISRKQYPAIFSNSSEVQRMVEQLTPLLAISVVFTNVQYTLQGTCHTMVIATLCLNCITMPPGNPLPPIHFDLVMSQNNICRSNELTKNEIVGVAIGAGWQVYVAYMSIGCYFLFGVPSGVIMAYKFEMGIKGLWCGMVVGLCLQTVLLLWMICVTNWKKECFKAEERIKQWRNEACTEEANDLTRE